MKKFFTLVILLMTITISGNTQVFLFEDFSTWVPDGWTIVDGPGSSPNSHWFQHTDLQATVYVTSENQDEWLITPEISLPSSGNLFVSADFKGSFYRMVTIDAGDFHVMVSTDQGSNWDIIWMEDDQAMVEASTVAWPWESNQWISPAIDLNAYAGEDIQIAFRYIAPDGEADWWNVDNVKVQSLIENEVELQSLVHPQYAIINESFEIEGSFINNGSNTIESIEVVYTINGVEGSSCLLDNLNVEYNATYDFTHDLPITYDEAGIFDIELIITQVNGEDDTNPDNNMLTHDISVATEAVDRIPLFEVLTSSTCPACPMANEAIDEVLANHEGEYSLVKYQVYWPGAGDPYYIIEDSIRSVYYDAGGVPDTYANGVDFDGFNFTESMYNSIASEDAFVEMEMISYFNGLDVETYLTIDPKMDILDASIHIAIVEKTTYENTGTNGETEFHNVLMEMLPDGYGNQTQLIIDETIEIMELGNLENTFIEEFDDLQIMAWIQDNETKYVLQSVVSDLLVGVDQIEDLGIMMNPNPAREYVNIVNAENSDVFIYDISGKLIKQFNCQSALHQEPILDINSGIYLVKVIREKEILSVEKLIIGE